MLLYGIGPLPGMTRCVSVELRDPSGGLVPVDLKVLVLRVEGTEQSSIFGIGEDLPV